MDFQVLSNLLEQQFPQAVAAVVTSPADPWVEVNQQAWLEVAQFLRDDSRCQFDFLNCISGVDYLETDPQRAAKATWQPHLELVYHLTSIRLKHRLAVKICLPRWRDDQPDSLPETPSVAHLWRTADWHEREVYDLVGVRFLDHPNLCRILCPEDWDGYPLRKDYQMPREYHGIRGR